MANMTTQGATFDSVHVGLYHVKITSPTVEVRKEYNEETTLIYGKEKIHLIKIIKK